MDIETTVSAQNTMKNTIALILLSVCTLTYGQTQTATARKPVTITDLYAQSIHAMNEGDVTKAEQNLRAILKVQPQHPQARYQLSQLTLNREKFAARARQLKMERTKIASVDFSGATVDECLDTLTTLIGDASEKSFSPNFVISDKNKKLESKTITLKLDNVPASQILNYIASNAECSVRYEEHAITVSAR
jgi:hypothetical protein